MALAAALQAYLARGGAVGLIERHRSWVALQTLFLSRRSLDRVPVRARQLKAEFARCASDLGMRIRLR